MGVALWLEGSANEGFDERQCHVVEVLLRSLADTDGRVDATRGDDMRRVTVLLIAVAMFTASCSSGTAETTTTRPSTTTVAATVTTLPPTTVASTSTTATISVPIPAPPFTLPSEILPASDGPFVWRWDAQLGSVREVPDIPTLIMGQECYGSGGNQVPSAVVEFDGSRIDFTLGDYRTPDVAITDEADTVTEVGNPFGADAWLCGVAANDSILLAVGSGVFWSDDGVTWHGIEAFEEYVDSEEWYSGLLWAAIGPEGYMVFGQDEIAHDDRRAWFSEDLQSWYVIPVDDPEDSYGWGLVGPTGVAVGNEPIIVTFDGAWVGTRP